MAIEVCIVILSPSAVFLVKNFSSDMRFLVTFDSQLSNQTNAFSIPKKIQINSHTLIPIVTYEK